MPILGSCVVEMYASCRFGDVAEQLGLPSLRPKSAVEGHSGIV
jgi:hypothetical protein